MNARADNDFYETPPWVTAAVLPELPLDGAELLEPAAGEGAILRAVYGRPARVAAIELDPTRAARIEREGLAHACTAGDFLTGAALGVVQGARRPTLVLTNPPFSHAEAFVRRAIDVVAPGGTVAMLLRLAFLEGQARARLHRQYPSDVFVLPRRPSFRRGHNRTITDRWAYAWFVWGPGRGRRWSILDAGRKAG